jgi:hypothetical protein
MLETWLASSFGMESTAILTMAVKTRAICSGYVIWQIVESVEHLIPFLSMRGRKQAKSRLATLANHGSVLEYQG